MLGFEREEDEIIRYYEKIKAADVFGVWGTELLLRLPLRKAERFMTKDHGWTPEAWEKSKLKKDHESVVNEIEDYFQFAWEKAVGHRGLSSSRSVHHFMAWTWLINDMELFEYAMKGRNYPNYGAPVILAVAHQYELFDFMPDNKTDYHVFMEMAQGRPCFPNCQSGCGVGNPDLYRPMPIFTPPNGILSLAK